MGPPPGGEKETSMRVAVITGAAQGIGRRTAEVLARRGYALALIDIQSTEGTREAVRKLGADATAELGDVSIEEEVVRIAEAVQTHFGRVDVLVNNAGISLIRPAEETGASEWRRGLEGNLTGPFLLCRSFGRLMLRQGGGAIDRERTRLDFSHLVISYYVF